MSFSLWASVFGFGFYLFQSLKTRALPKPEDQSLKTKARKPKPEDQSPNKYGFWSSGFSLRASVFGIRALVWGLGTPCFVVLIEYRSGHSIFSFILLCVTVRPENVGILSKREPLSAGKDYLLECKSHGSRPPATITWWKNSKFINNAESQVNQFKMFDFTGHRSPKVYAKNIFRLVNST